MTRRLALLLAMLFSAPALADDTHALRVGWTHDLTASGALAAGWIGTELSKDELAAPACRWCEPPAFDASVRRRLRWDDGDRAATYSDVADFAVLPVLVLGADALLAAQHGALRNAPEDEMIIVQAALFASAVNQVVKLSVARQRPFVHDRAGGVSDDPHDDNLSFYSGHTSLAFALVSATGTVATMRGYRNAWAIWPAGALAAATIGYLRIAADKHWLSDVAIGAAMGTAIGVGAPLLLHPRTDRKHEGTVTFAADTRRIAIAFVF